MYFLIACREEPPLSFRPAIAALTMSAVGGCAGFTLGLFEPAAPAFAVFFAFGVEAGAEEGAVAAVSAIVNVPADF